MFKLIETLRSKPTDRNIRIIRIVFALILLGVIFFGFQNTTWNYSQIPSGVLYILYLFPIIGLIRGIFDPGIMRKKLWEWTQVGIGTFFILLSWFFIETNTNGTIITMPPTVSGELSAVDLVKANSSNISKGGVDTDFWIGFFGFWLVLAGLTITSKNITTKNERFGEKVKKIRV